MKKFKERLNDDLNFNIRLKEYINKITQIKKIIIWRASGAGQIVYDFLKEFKLEYKVKGFIDNDSIKWGREFNKIEILSPRDILNNMNIQDNSYIIVANPTKNIVDQIILQGFNESQLDITGYFIIWEYLNRLYLQSHIDKYEKVYNMLVDQKSKEIYIARLNMKLTGDTKYLQNCVDDSKQYFDKELIKLNENEVFVDCGSFNGDTLDIFYKLTKGKYEKYIAIEADNEAYKELETKIKHKQYARVELLKKACWNEKTMLQFNTQQGESNCITENGDIIVEADSLDQLLKENKITFIKMDIEGAEEKALIGAQVLINKNSPILAICIYHKIEDDYKLPLLIKHLNEDYCLFIRHYRDIYGNISGTETVCYAIPKERNHSF